MAGDVELLWLRSWSESVAVDVWGSSVGSMVD